MQKRNSLIIALVLVAALSVGGGYLGSILSGSGNRVIIHEVSERVGVDDQTDTTVLAGYSGTASEDSSVSTAFQNQFRRVAKETLPTVVELNVVTTVTQTIPTNPFEFFFNQQNGGKGPNQNQRQFQQRGLGSGVLVGKDNNTVYVLTNAHVVNEDAEIEVVLNDDRSFTGKLVGADSLMDLALVSFEVPSDDNIADIPVATLGNSDSLEIGDWVFAVGNPLGFESTVTAGIVSAMERNAQPGSGMSGIASYIQTDAAINQGNSGGALVNLNGEVVGINTWIASQTGGNIGLGFAIPINMAKRAINDLITTGEVSYSWLGVLVGTPDDQSASDLSLEGRDGAFVYSVYLDSPAGSAGIRAGDLITAIGDSVVTDANSLVRAVAALPPDRRVSARIVRDGTEIEVAVRTTERDTDAGNDATMLWPAISIVGLTPELRDELSLGIGTRGVVIASVTSGSPAEGSGLQQGDVITAVNGEQVRSASDFYHVLGDLSGDEVQFRLYRGGTTLILGFVRPEV